MLAVRAAGTVGTLQCPTVLRILVDLVGGLEEPRFNGDDQTRTQLVAVVGATVVRHMRIAVHDTADAVAAEFKVDRITVFASHIADSCGDITQTIARLRSGDTSFQSLFGALDQAQILRILMFADHKADGGIGNPTVDVDRQIEADQIAVFQVVVERNAMQHRIVHGNANVMCERTGAKIRSVVDVAGFGSLAIDDALVHEFVDFQQIGTNFGEFLEITQNTADETSGRIHCFVIKDG